MAAAETRAKILEKLQEDMANRMAVEQNHQEKLDNMEHKMEYYQEQNLHHMGVMDKKYDSLKSSIEMLSLQVSKAVERMDLYNKDKPILGPSPSVDPSSQQSFLMGNMTHQTPHTTLTEMEFRNQRIRGENEHHGYFGNTNPRFDFPRFDGNNPRSWLLKCLSYFKLMRTPPDADKVSMAALHFEGKAMEWYQQISQEDRVLTWDHFVELVSNRFGELKEGRVFTEFSKLKVKGSLEEYIEKFLELKSHLLMFNRRSYDESYFVDSFISGLHEEMRQCFLIFTPQTLTQTIDTARMHEATAEAAAKKNRSISKSFQTSPTFHKRPTNQTYSPPNLIPKVPNYTSPTLQPSRKLLTTTEMRARREQGLCYNCDEKFSPGHKCKESHMYWLMTEDEEAAHLAISNDEDTHENIEISLNALAGSTGSKTIKVQGVKGKHKLQILIDTGSSHSFISEPLAYHLGCEIMETPTINVQIPDGTKMRSNKFISNFNWIMEEEEFQFPLRLLQLGGYHIILGCDWLEEVAPVTFDHRTKSITVLTETKCIKLEGLKNGPTCALISAQSMYKLLNQVDQQEFGYVFSLHTDNSESVVHPGVEGLLRQYGGVFMEPTCLPPIRGIEHQIILKEGSVPKQIYPYRYSHAYKGEIEKIVQELLGNGTIRHSQSPFASPVLLVRKKDSTWRMCVDYRYLNTLTVKHNYPIPVIDELLDELHGACWFSKLDLRSGYFQIRMKDSDIYKTAFKTHNGHYEFLVMPFGLCNAPATFQNLMNQIFAPYLRKFILVFFDDILVYSSSFEDHLQHLELTLTILKDHQLFAKQPKCQFAQEQIEYLGHIISKNGVATDPQKIQCMVDWPKPSSVKGLRGFLGLTGYYRKFIKNYGLICKPLTNMLKKGGFTWTEEAEFAFIHLKEAMTTSPVLALPNFSQPFVVETDASSKGLGAVLMQNNRPIAFISKALSPRNQSLSIYEREFMAVLLAI